MNYLPGTIFSIYFVSHCTCQFSAASLLAKQRTKPRLSAALSGGVGKPNRRLVHHSSSISFYHVVHFLFPLELG